MSVVSMGIGLAIGEGEVFMYWYDIVVIRVLMGYMAIHLKLC